MKASTLEGYLKPLVAEHFVRTYPNIAAITDSDFQWSALGEQSDFILGIFGKLFFRMARTGQEGYCLFRLKANGAIATDGTAAFNSVIGATNFDEEMFERIKQELEREGIHLTMTQSYFDQ